MKRSLSLVLALVMILGSFSTVFAAEPVTTGAEAGAFLNKVGVLVGNDKGDLMLDNNLLRQDTAILVSKLMGQHDEAAKFEGTVAYEDIRNNFYLPVLAWAQDNGTFVGQSATEFGFGKNITAQEYAKVLLTALGYKVAPNGDSDIKWAEALVKATEFGILKNVKVENATEITRGDMALMTFNALSVKMKDSTKTLAEFLNIEMPVASELKLEEVKTENLKEVIMVLNDVKAADEAKLLDINNYKISSNKVVRATLDGNNVILELATALKPERKYEIIARSGVKALQGTHKFTAVDNTAPEVVNVEAIGTHGILVQTSEPVRNPQERDFLIDGRNVSMKVEVYGRDIVLTPYYDKAFSEGEQEITIKNIEDYADFKVGTTKHTINIAKDEVAPKVEKVEQFGDRTVKVTFDKDIYAKSLSGYVNRKNVGNVSYELGRDVIYAESTDANNDDLTIKFERNVAIYSFKEELPRRYDLAIEGVMNHSEVKMEKTTETPVLVVDNTEPMVIDDSFDATAKTMTLEFDKNVLPRRANTDANGKITKDITIGDHFAVYQKTVSRVNDITANVIDKVEYDVEANGDIIFDTVIVTFKNLEVNNKYGDFDYILEVENFVDFTSSRNKMDREYFEFELSQAAKAFAVVGISQKLVGNGYTEFKIDFSKPVDRTIAGEADNYLFTRGNSTAKQSVKDLGGRVIVEENGQTVTLRLMDFEKAVTKYDLIELEVAQIIKDKDGKRLSNKAVYDLVTGAISNGEYKMVKNAAGAYEITPNAGVKAITLKTDARETFVVNGNLDKLTIDAKNAHVIVNGIVDEVVIVAIGANSLQIVGSVAKLVVSTKETVNVYGNVANMEISSTVDKATLTVGLTATTTSSVTVVKGEVKNVKADGTTENVDQQAGAKAQADKINASGSAIALEVAEADKGNVTKVTEKAVKEVQKLVAEGYTVTAENTTIRNEKLYVIFAVKEDKVASNTATTIQIVIDITVK